MSSRHNPIKSKKNLKQNNSPVKTGFSFAGQKIEIYKGQLPHPDILERLEVIHPGITKELLHLVKEQTLHRISIEGKVVDSNISNSKKGLNYGFIIAVLGILGSIYLILNGFEISGSVLGSTSLISLVSVFVYGSKQRERELKTKKEKL